MCRSSRRPTTTTAEKTEAETSTDPGGGGATVEIPKEPALNRFHGSVRLDPIRLGRDASRIAEEVIQHLSSIVDADVDVTLEIHAKLPEGAGEKLVRDVTENCRTLRFDNYGFEES